MFALLRIVIILAIIGGIGYGAMAGLDYFVSPEQTMQQKNMVVHVTQ